MEKIFEDKFMEAQIEVIKLCLELSGDSIDEIYAYGSIEKNSMSFNAFYVINKEVKTIDQMNIKDNVMWKFIELGMQDLNYIKEVCLEFSMPIPTELKMIYDHRLGKFDTKYKYDPVASSETGIDSSQIFMNWVEEIRSRNL